MLRFADSSVRIPRMHQLAQDLSRYVLLGRVSRHTAEELLCVPRALSWALVTVTCRYCRKFL